MYSLNKRQSEIIQILIGRENYMTIKEISQLFGVSERTIRYDLNQIKLFLNENNHILESVPNKGTKIIIDKFKKKQIEKLLLTQRSFSNEEKENLIILELLTNDNCTYESIAEDLNVSRATIINNIDNVENKLSRFNLLLTKEKGKGIKISGNECSIYDCFITIVNNNYRNSLFSKNISLFYNENYLSKVNEIISNIEKELKISFYEIERLEIILCFILFRIDKNYKINRLLKHIKNVQLDNNYDKYIKALKVYDYDENHKIYIVSILMNSKFRSLNKTSNSKGMSNEIAKFLLAELEKIQSLSKQERNKFLLSLSTHLEVALYRIRNNIPIQNALRDQIRICLPLTYEFTKKQLLKCEKEYNILFSEDEISYIAMYVGSVYETSVQLDKQISVLLICSFGMTTSTILESRLKQLLPECKYVGPFSKKEALKYLANNDVDLIISTGDEEYGDIPVVLVNPLLYKEDIEYIRAQLFELNYSMMCKTFIDTYVHKYEKKHNNYLADIIDKNNIQIIDKVDNWKDSIKLAAKPLLEKEKIEERYINKMIDAVLQLGTYMVILPETAFVHAGIEDGINEACCSMLVMKEPILFGEGKSKIVRNVIVIGFKEKEKTTLLDLVNILNSNNNMEILKKEDLNINDILKLHD